MRIDWKSEEPPSNMHDGRPDAALHGLGLEWAELDWLRETLSTSAHIAEKHAAKDILDQNADFLYKYKMSWYKACRPSRATL